MKATPCLNKALINWINVLDMVTRNDYISILEFADGAAYREILLQLDPEIEPYISDLKSCHEAISNYV